MPFEGNDEAAIKDELNEYTLNELKTMADENGIEYKKSISKAGLIEKIAGEINA